MRKLAMSIMVGLIALTVMPTLIEACSCADGGSACGALFSTPVVFVGMVTRDTGKGLGERFGRMHVEEVLHGLPSEVREVEVDTMAGTSCYMPLEEGRRLVLYGSLDTKNSSLVHYHPCSFSFAVEGNERLLDALRAAEVGEPARLVGSVTKRIEKYSSRGRASGITVVATNGEDRLETQTTADGQFEFRVVEPGKWKLRVVSDRLLNDPDSFKPDLESTVPPNGCVDRGLLVVADGHISGTVMNPFGKPVPDVRVQAFNFEGRDHKLDTMEFAYATTDQQGAYDIGGLPPQDYVIGINAELYRDASPYPPVFYGSNSRIEASPISLKEAERRSGINLMAANPRSKATVIMELHYEDGTLVTYSGDLDREKRVDSPVDLVGADASDLDGVQKMLQQPEEPFRDGRIRLEVWAGETYRFKAWRFEVDSIMVPGGGLKTTTKNWEGTLPSIRIIEPVVLPITIRLKPNK